MIHNWQSSMNCTPEEYCKQFGHKPRKYGDGIFCQCCEVPMPDAKPATLDGKKHHYVFRDGKTIEVSESEIRAIEHSTRNVPQGCTCGTGVTCWKHEKPHDLSEYQPGPDGKLP